MEFNREYRKMLSTGGEIDKAYQHIYRKEYEQGTGAIWFVSVVLGLCGIITILMMLNVIK